MSSPARASNFSIAGRVVLITGAGAGIGRAMARGLAASGARVACVDQNLAAAQAVEAELGRNTALALGCNVSREDEVEAAIVATNREWGRIDALINNAGVYKKASVAEHTLKNWEWIFGVNVTGTFLCTKAVLPYMIAQGEGRIINFTSALGVRSHAGGAAYGASKAAVASFTNTLHQEVADHGIRVTAIAPGLINTALATANQSEEYITRVASQYPGGRLGEPEDIVGLAHFLISPASEHLSGSVVYVRPVGG